MPTTSLAKFEQRKDYSPRRERCHSDETYAPISPEKACKLGAEAEEASFAIWADSHGAELAHELDGVFKARQKAFIQLTSSGCPPLLGLDMPKKQGCREHNAAVIAMLKATNTIRTVVLMWHQNEYLDVRSAQRFAGFRRTLAALVRSDKMVVVIGPLPMPEYHVPSAMARVEWRKISGFSFSQPIATFRRKSSDSAMRLRQIATEYGAGYFDPAPVFCDKSKCRFVEGDTALYFDDNHLSLAGARKLAEILAPEALDRRALGFPAKHN
jgi:SGNH domain (fused to AT3 domains)